MQEKPLSQESAKKTPFWQIMKDIYMSGVDELWFIQNGTEPDRQSQDYLNFLQAQSPPDFESRTNSEVQPDSQEEFVLRAAAQRLQRQHPQ